MDWPEYEDKRWQAILAQENAAILSSDPILLGHIHIGLKLDLSPSMVNGGLSVYFARGLVA